MVLFLLHGLIQCKEFVMFIQSGNIVSTCAMVAFPGYGVHANLLSNAISIGNVNVQDFSANILVMLISSTGEC